MFCLVLQCRFRQFEKVPNFVLGQALSSSCDRSTVYAHSNINIHAVSVGFGNPSNYDTDYRIFNVPMCSFNACIYTCVLFAFIL